MPSELDHLSVMHDEFVGMSRPRSDFGGHGIRHPALSVHGQPLNLSPAGAETWLLERLHEIERLETAAKRAR